MRLRVEQLGPLHKADIDLRHDLIVLTGPNNSGKTWFAWTVYALMQQRAALAERLIRDEMIDALLAQQTIQVEIPRLDAALSEAVREVSLTQTKQLPDVFAAAKTFFDAARLTWSVPPTPSKGERSLTLVVGRSSWGIRTKRSGSESIQLSVVSNEPPVATPAEAPSREVVRALLARVFDIAYVKSLDSMRETTLFPAERLAVNLFARELAASRVELVEDALAAEANGRDPVDLMRRAGRFPMPIQDSLSVANRLEMWSRQDTPFADLAEELERSLLGGSVRATAQGELHFSPASTQVSLPVHMTASVVKSLASFTFYLRHIARPGDFVILDEPELNLHPDAQRKVARFLGRLVNRGFKLMISTHSDFVVRELGHLVMLAHAGERGRALAVELGLDPDTLIAPERLGAWLFHDGTAEQIPVDGTGFGVRTIDDEIARMNADAQQIYARLAE